MELSGKNVLVTGGAGFIGSHVVESLLQLGARVTVFDNFDDFYDGKEENLRNFLSNPRLRVVRGTILDSRALGAVTQGADIVIHEAAQAGVRYCNSNPKKASNVNVTGTLNVLLAAKEHRVKKVVYASSSSVYGMPVKVPMDEEHPQYPTNPYGASKLAAERYCLAFHTTYGLDVVCLRYFSVYGPRGRPDQVLYSFANSVSRNNPPTILGSLSTSRDFTYVSDIVSATILSAMNDEVNSHVINVGYGKEIRILDAARDIIRYFERDMEPLHSEAYAGDFPRTLCSNQKALRLLGWKPAVRFDDGLRRFLDWFVKTGTIPSAGHTQVKQETKE
jgi:UDP-glucose 4-epimerase